jgi:long-chain acyl-CoA synthetase
MRLGDIAERNARHAGNLEAIIFKSRRLTWKAFDDRTNSIANGLLKIGVKKGDRVALYLANSDAIINCYYGIPKMGAITVPLNTMLSKREIEYIINDCKPEVLIYSSTFESIVKTLKEQEGCKSLKTFFYFDQDCTGFKSEFAMNYEDLATQNSKDSPKMKIDDREPFMINYTGGTTGNPKGVLLSQFSVVQSALLTIASGGGENTTLERGDRVLLPLPIFHLAATLGVITSSLAIATIIALDSFNISEMLRIAEIEKATTMCFIPTMLNLFVQQEDLIKSRNLANLKYIIYGAAPMHVAILKKAMGLFPGIKFTGGYGLSEFSPVIAWLTPEDHKFALQKPENEYMLLSAGRPMTGVTLKIVDQNDKELPYGQVGEIVVQGDGTMLGYWNLPEKTKETLRGGWLHTGDMAYLNEENYIFIVDRSKDMIKSGSENVFSKEVEDALYKHEAVLECAVIARPDPKWGEAVHAVVVLKRGFKEGQNISEQALIYFCKEYIAHYKAPKSIEFKRALPKSAQGKILKRELREKFWGAGDRKVG